MGEEQAEQIISEDPEMLGGDDDGVRKEPAGRELLLVSLAALGVVYGDIGTSPLYALRKCFHGDEAVVPSTLNVLGVLSLITWSLVIVISIKYITYVMRADNRGEGGILALMAIAVPRGSATGKGRWFLAALGIFGAALLYGDGMITPAISVLSAVEGLELVTPALAPYVVPATIAILLLLFLFQHRGTSAVGLVFGPVMTAWFATIAVLGIGGIAREPAVLAAASPHFAARFFLENGWVGFMVLGAVFLVVTGGEALYADIGHFGRRPIRLAWFSMVLPALLLNYFGQGALLLRSPAEVNQPFFLLAPRWVLVPLLVLATAATVIASQAVISGAFSLTRQAVLLGHLPRVRILQTSSKEIGQIYIPSVNWLLMLATILLVITFRQSTNLAAAYGVAVSTTMVITTILAYPVARERWKWSPAIVISITVLFLVVDTAFFCTNILKIRQGGWVPLLIGGMAYVLMSTWKRGRTVLGRVAGSHPLPLGDFVRGVADKPPLRVPGTAVFLTENYTATPLTLIRHLEHNHVLHEQVVVLTVSVEEIPRVASADRPGGRWLGAGLLPGCGPLRFHGNAGHPGEFEEGQAVGAEHPARRGDVLRGASPSDSRGQAPCDDGVAGAAVCVSGPQRRRSDHVLWFAAGARRRTRHSTPTPADGKQSMMWALGACMLAAAVLLSMLGQGGGSLYTPIQTWFGIGFHEAAATSLFLIMATSFSSSLVYRKANRIDWHLAITLETITAAGGFFGGIVSEALSGMALSLLLAGVLAIGAYFMIRWPEADPRPAGRPAGRFAWQRTLGERSYQVNMAIGLPISFVAGTLSGLLGLGGGILKVPMMVLLMGIPMEIAVGSSAVMVGMTAAAGLAGHVVHEHWNWRTSLVLAAVVFVGAQIGSRISLGMEEGRLKVFFGWFLLAVAGIMAATVLL